MPNYDDKEVEDEDAYGRVCAILVAVAANRSGFTWATSEWDLSCVRFPSMGYFITVVVDSKMVIIAGDM
jgi:hypothetical protein